METLLDIHTPDQVRGLLATLLAGAAGGAASTWSKRIGDVERVPTWKYVRHNWIVHPTGTPEQRATIDKAVELVRAEHPYIR